jgi:hypothetical protein
LIRLGTPRAGEEQTLEIVDRCCLGILCSTTRLSEQPNAPSDGEANSQLEDRGSPALTKQPAAAHLVAAVGRMLAVVLDVDAEISELDSGNQLGHFNQSHLQ